ncbi:unnamed protein product [Linum tenue]|uniref:Uncharacterized protein n=1 Tax=Linum tenue TaxID=586396 RepID=A0AAV0K1Y9_9ROSI|nr:unnamed protein product [Linum tenue]
MLPSRFSLFGGGGVQDKGRSSSVDGMKSELVPTFKLQTDRDVYRPGDSIFVTIEISNPCDGAAQQGMPAASLLVERLGFEIKGIEKLDNQWFATPKPVSGSRQRRGEHVFMDCSTSSLVSNHVISSGATKTYVIRTVLPSTIPPSYRGATIRYMYYVKGMLSARWLILDNGHSRKESRNDLIFLEARNPLQVWVTQKNNGLTVEEGPNEGIVPANIIQLDVYWREMDGESEWARANDIEDALEEGYESSRDEVSSVSSYNPGRESIHKTFGSSLSLQSASARSPTPPLPRLSVAEVLYDPATDLSSSDKNSAVASPRLLQNTAKSHIEDENAGVSSAAPAKTDEPAPSEGFSRGRSYNIRMDDRVLLRFSPRNSDSTYYFSDMIGGTLTFFHEEGARRCLEVSITLETSETISRRSVHPSRKNSPTITKVQSDHHEVVADLQQTSFLFSIPMDGPMSFSTPRVAVQWALRFEFFTTPKNVDWRRYEHPLLIEGRDKSDWVLPIIVHATPPAAQAAHARNEKLFSLDPLWVQT